MNFSQRPLILQWVEVNAEIHYCSKIVELETMGTQPYIEHPRQSVYTNKKKSLL